VVTIQFRLPVPSSELLANLLGLAGLVAVVVGAGGLLGNWWVSLVLAGGVCVFLSWVATQQPAQATSSRVGSAAAPADVLALKRILADAEQRTRVG